MRENTERRIERVAPAPRPSLLLSIHAARPTPTQDSKHDGEPGDKAGAGGEAGGWRTVGGKDAAGGGAGLPPRWREDERGPR